MRKPRIDAHFTFADVLDHARSPSLSRLDFHRPGFLVKRDASSFRGLISSGIENAKKFAFRPLF
jgi:hypothetical protein